MQKKAALAFGIILVVFGVLGFVPSLLTDMYGVPYLFGAFAIGAILNVLHMVAGAIGLLAASSARYSRWYLQLGGIVFGAVAFAGFLQGDTILGALDTNIVTNMFHAGVAAVMLAAGFLLAPDAQRRPLE